MIAAVTGPILIHTGHAPTPMTLLDLVALIIVVLCLVGAFVLSLTLGSSGGDDRGWTRGGGWWGYRPPQPSPTQPPSPRGGGVVDPRLVEEIDLIGERFRESTLVGSR